MDVRRNSRFDIGQQVEILFNPIAKLQSGTTVGGVTHGEYESFINYSGFTGDASSVSAMDVIANKYFGGRVATAAPQVNMVIGVSYDTFAEENYNYIANYTKTDTFVFESRTYDAVTDRYFYCLNGAGYLVENLGGASGDNNRILNSFITERAIKVNNQRFGYGYQHFNNNWVDTIGIAIPATIEEWKLTQMLNSVAVAVKGDNTIYGSLPIYSEYDVEYDAEYGEDTAGVGEYVLIEDYNYYKQYSGGSCSPVIRLVNLDRTTLNFNKRRNVFEIEAVILG